MAKPSLVTQTIRCQQILRDLFKAQYRHVPVGTWENRDKCLIGLSDDPEDVWRGVVLLVDEYAHVILPLISIYLEKSPPPLEGLFVWRTEWRSVYVCVCILGRGGGEGGVWMETAFRYISIIALSTHDMSYLWQRSVDVDDLISPNLGPRTRSALGCHVVCGGCQRFGGTECTSKRTHFIFLQKSPFPR